MQLSELLNMEVMGNAYNDRILLDGLNLFIADSSNTMEDRKIAYLYLSNEVVGETIDSVSDADILQHADIINQM